MSSFRRKKERKKEERKMGLLEFMTKCLHSGERKKERKKDGFS